MVKASDNVFVCSNLVADYNSLEAGGWGGGHADKSGFGAVGSGRSDIWRTSPYHAVCIHVEGSR